MVDRQRNYQQDHVQHLGDAKRSGVSYSPSLSHEDIDALAGTFAQENVRDGTQASRTITGIYRSSLEGARVAIGRLGVVGAALATGINFYTGQEGVSGYPHVVGSTYSGTGAARQARLYCQSGTINTLDVTYTAGFNLISRSSDGANPSLAALAADVILTSSAGVDHQNPTATGEFHVDFPSATFGRSLNARNTEVRIYSEVQDTWDSFGLQIYNTKTFFARRAGISLYTDGAVSCIFNDSASVDHTRVQFLDGTLAAYVNLIGGTYTNGSSERFKKDIAPVVHRSLDRVSRLSPKRFRYKQHDGDDNEQPLQLGFIAEEIADIIPEAVTLDSEGRPEGIMYHVVVTELVKAVQELKEQIDRGRP